MNLQRPFRVSDQLIRQDRAKSAADAGRTFAFKSAAVGVRNTTFAIKTVREAADGLFVEAVLSPEFVDYKALKAHFENRDFAERFVCGQNNARVPAGKIISLNCDDANGEISVIALVTDAAEISKTRERVYTSLCLSADEASLMDNSIGA